MADHTSPLDNLLHSTSARTLQYERQLKELEVSRPNLNADPTSPLRPPQSKLSEHLGNSRTIDTSLRQVYAGIQVRSDQLPSRPNCPCSPNYQRNVRRTDRAIDVYVPHINRAFDDALKSLLQLETTLPVTRAQIKEIWSVYDAGRVKVCLISPENIPWAYIPYSLGSIHG